MYVRLAFATAVHVEPDVLLVDEALAVGDAIFSNRCIQKFEEFKRRGVTVLFVSHDLGLVKQIADRAIFLLDGQIAAEGRPGDVVNRYVGMVLERREREQRAEAHEHSGLRSSHRHGDGASRIEEVALINRCGAPATVFEAGEPVRVRIRARFRREVDEPVVGILVRNRLGLDVFGTNTRVEGRRLGRFGPGERLEIEFGFDCLLTRQEYTLTVATQNWDGTSQDWLDDVLAFRVVDAKERAGVANLRTEISWRRH